MNQDFKELLQTFAELEVEYLADIEELERAEKVKNRKHRPEQPPLP